MDLAWISLAALLLVVAVSCTSTVNAGLLSIALAWLLGIYIAPALGTPLEIKQLVAVNRSNLAHGVPSFVGKSILRASAGADLRAHLRTFD